MTAALEFRIQPAVHNHLCEILTDHARAESNHIRIVVLPRHLCAVGLRADRRAYALYLIRREAYADARAANQHAAVRLSACDHLGRAITRERVLIALLRIRADVHDFDAALF